MDVYGISKAVPAIVPDHANEVDAQTANVPRTAPPHEAPMVKAVVEEKFVYE